MTPNGIAKLTAATAIATVLAGILYASHNSWSAGVVTGEPVLPALANRVGDIAAIRLEQAGRSLTLKRGDGDAWGIEERGGYPVRPEKVRQLLLALGEARLVEPKTRAADKYALLELDDPAGKDAKSRAVRLLAKDGRALGEIVVGKSAPEAFGAGKGGVYVRKPGDPQSWLADKAPEVTLAVRDWVERSILVLDAAKQKQLTLAQEGGEAPIVVKAKLKDGKADGFEFGEAIPEGKKAKSEGLADGIARAFGILDLEDVRKAVAPAAGDTVQKATLETSDGMTIAFDLVRDKDAGWLSLAASGTADAVKEQVAAIGKRAAGWQFKLPASTVEQLFKTRADLYEVVEKDKEKK